MLSETSGGPLSLAVSVSSTALLPEAFPVTSSARRAGGPGGSMVRMNLLFDDPRFPCTQKSIAKDDEDLPPGAKSLAKWARPEPGKTRLFAAKDATRAPPGIVVGGLSDAWFLGAVAALGTRADTTSTTSSPSPPAAAAAAAARTLLEGLFVEESASGRVVVRFFQLGQWVEVEVDNQLPVSESGTPIFGRSEDPGETHVSLVEKAYAKLCGSYAMLMDGSVAAALLDLTGGVTSEMDFESPEDEGGLTAEEAFSELTAHCAKGNVVVVEARGKRKKIAERGNLKPRWPYPVVDCRVVAGARLVKLRNPWGSDGEWNGAWSPKSPLWTSEAKAQAGGYSPGLDGHFWMPCDDLVASFSSATVCEPMPEREWACASIPGSWKGASAGGMLGEAPSGKFNRQYSLTVPVATEVVVSLIQEDPRFSLVKEVTFAAGLHVLKARDVSAPLLHFARSDVVAESDVWTDRIESSVACRLTSGTYVIVPSTAEPGCEGTFLLRVFSGSGAETKLRELPALGDAYDTSSITGKWDGKWEGGLAGGCFRFSGWVANPQFLLHVLPASGAGGAALLATAGGAGRASAAPLILSLTQPDAEVPQAISFYVLKGSSDKRPRFDQAKALDTLKFTKRREVFQELPLEPSLTPYLVLPATFKPGFTGDLTLTLYRPKGRFEGARIAEVPREARWVTTRAKGAWSGLTAGGCANNQATWAHNPTFGLEVLDRTEVTIVLGQVHHGRGDDAEADDVFQIGMHLLGPADDGDVIEETAQWDKEATVTLQATLKKGKYRIRPSTFEPREQCPFVISIFSDNEVVLTAPNVSQRN